MYKTIITNTETGISKKCDILKKNDKLMEVVLEDTTIKLTLRKKNNLYIGNFKNMEFVCKDE
ncbi:MAG: hypothetical protein CFH18_00096 [Alphaproteobacteria bacterium MarineAlpha5_Bin8]|nr:MAG: hypothetical protein CFH17_01236 [Alphaproteobacteria bacterium MarineAlpha5_Bin7]PPR48287.1 MAG: hypothetical protein CFH18_00096 [Alphaproteobacteria bacterium MarineAlpha5_Bin8]PPR54512.1 MAG: hypothetical protein CFH16_00385 [Alphaproteobacteria bacterium MarineAlpha5_Bin6]|tara:strand:+ start:1279 stop:1464 length:186 start_codon:yes stop_codon:yes gene_type:complete